LDVDLRASRALFLKPYFGPFHGNPRTSLHGTRATKSLDFANNLMPKADHASITRALGPFFKMKNFLSLASLAIAALLSFPLAARAGHAEIDALVAAHARANNVPEALVHRVILRESRYQPQLVGRGGCIGLMQIKLATARGLGYTGDAAGLRDPDTNLTYGIKYLAGAYRAANGDHARAMHYYASGYYYAAKRERLLRARAQQRF
jgi:soluble lytic murein transglycosylase-like protein